MADDGRKEEREGGEGGGAGDVLLCWMEEDLWQQAHCEQDKIVRLHQVQLRLVIGSVTHNNAFVDYHKESKTHGHQNYGP